MKASVLILAPGERWPGSLTAAIEAYGYRVLVAPTAGIALGALRHIRFDVLVGPSASPTISGLELGKQARLIQPALRLVAISEPDSSADHLLQFDAVIKEPLTPLGFHQTIAAVWSPSPRSDPAPSGS